MKKGKTNSRVLATGLVAGALLGTALGLLVAPKEGKETRKVVKEKADGYISVLRERYGKNDVPGEPLPESNGHGKVPADVDLR